jgi:hypothetical protein
MTNFERKKKNGALDALRGHRTGRLAGILADIGSDFKAESTASVGIGLPTRSFAFAASRVCHCILSGESSAAVL